MWSFHCRLKQLSRPSVRSIFLERRRKFGWDYLLAPSMVLFTPFIWINLGFLVFVHIRVFLLVSLGAFLSCIHLFQRCWSISCSLLLSLNFRLIGWKG